MSPAAIIRTLEQDGMVQQTLTLERNEYLNVCGAINTHIYFVESGSLSIYITDGDEERIIRFGYKDNIIVALDSFLSGRPSDFYIQAIRKTTVKVITKETFTRFIGEQPERLNIWIRILEDLVLQQIEREKDLLVQSPKERYMRVLKRSPQLFQEIPHKYIANYLRMTPETLSRLKNS